MITCDKCKYACKITDVKFNPHGKTVTKAGIMCKHPNAGYRRTYPFYGSTKPNDCPEAACKKCGGGEH